MIEEIKRGKIFYIEKMGGYEVGSEQRSGRPAIVVSNDKCNAFSDVIEVVYLTTQPKSDLPTHIDIRSTQRASVALCEQINSVSVQRVGEYVATCSPYEMTMVDAALAISLGLEFEKPKEKTVSATPAPKAAPKEEPKKAPAPETAIEIAKITAERDTYKTLYESLFERMVAK